jgi:hypothetical protein
MRLTHLDEIKKLPNVAILATAHNTVANPFEWVGALIKGRAAIEQRQSGDRTKIQKAEDSLVRSVQSSGPYYDLSNDHGRESFPPQPTT